MRIWGVSQFEFSQLVGVSYDSVASWCSGRRSFTRVDLLAQFEDLEATAARRGFVREIELLGPDPLTAQRQVARPVELPEDGIPADLIGRWAIGAFETQPGEARTAGWHDALYVAAGEDGALSVVLSVGDATWSFIGRWRDFRGTPLLELFPAQPDERFFGACCGSVVRVRRDLMVSLWSRDAKLPVRLLVPGESRRS